MHSQHFFYLECRRSWTLARACGAWAFVHLPEKGGRAARISPTIETEPMSGMSAPLIPRILRLNTPPLTPNFIRCGRFPWTSR